MPKPDLDDLILDSEGLLEYGTGAEIATLLVAGVPHAITSIPIEPITSLCAVSVGLVNKFCSFFKSAEEYRGLFKDVDLLKNEYNHTIYKSRFSVYGILRASSNFYAKASEMIANYAEKHNLSSSHLLVNLGNTLKSIGIMLGKMTKILGNAIEDSYEMEKQRILGEDYSPPEGYSPPKEDHLKGMQRATREIFRGF